MRRHQRSSKELRGSFFSLVVPQEHEWSPPPQTSSSQKKTAASMKRQNQEQHKPLFLLVQIFYRCAYVEEPHMMWNFVTHPDVWVTHIAKKIPVSHGCLLEYGWGLNKYTISHGLEPPFCDRINTQDQGGHDLAMKKEGKRCTAKRHMQKVLSK